VELNAKNKAYIDGLNYYQLLQYYRFARAGDPWFQGETGIYWGDRMNELRSKEGGQEAHVAASKGIGWEKP
jgi:hypothetical protein